MCPPKLLSEPPPSGLKDRLLGRSDEWVEIEDAPPPASDRPPVSERAAESCEPKSLRDLLARLRPVLR